MDSRVMPQAANVEDSADERPDTLVALEHERRIALERTEAADAHVHLPDPGRVDADAAEECRALDGGELFVRHRGELDAARVGQAREGLELCRPLTDGQLTREGRGDRRGEESNDPDHSDGENRYSSR